MTAPPTEAPAAPPIPAPGATRAAREPSPRWFWPGFVAVLLVSAALQLIRLDRQGVGNPYYAAAVRSMLENFNAFFFASFDAAGWVTVDKPPLGLWAQTLGARLLGFGPWGLLLPQALATIAAVALVALLVRRAFGPAAGLPAGLMLALTPVAVAVGRTNEVDATLTLFVLLGAWALLHGVDGGHGRWALLAAACVGLAFNVKMLEAYLVAPAFALAWLCCARVPLRVRIAQLAGAAAVLLVVSFAWAAVVELTPPDRRPYIGSSAHNSIFELIVGYNGLDRLLPPGWTLGGWLPGANGSDRPNPAMVLAAFGAIETGPRGPQRLFNPLLGGQTSWLLPLAVLGLVLAAAQTRRLALPAVQRRQFAALWLWGGWLATGFAFFSVANQFHRYYLVVLAPPVAALAGIGLAALWRDFRQFGWRGWLLPLAIASTAALALWLLRPFPTSARWLGPSVALLAFIGVALLVMARTRRLATSSALQAGRWLDLGLAASLAAILLGPAVWSAHALWQPVNNILPAAGPDIGFAL
ncbi:MAG TPA: glycosyltransferase family 39 protein, partial [Thermomicrobiales bacterium]|nr:glycosyltransferase family 39 protein [Thermomicrobiales bacterium]